MRISFADPRVALLGLVVGCQPPPTEASTESAGDSSGPPSTTTTMTSPVGDDTTTTTSPSEDTTAGSSGSTSVGVVSTSSSEGTSGTSSSSSSSGSESEGESSTGEPVDEPLGPFDPATAVVELNSPASDDDPTLTGDLLEIYFGSTRAGIEDIWMSTRATVADPWEPPTAVAELNSAAVETFPEVSPDGLVILLASDRTFGGDLDVYYSQRASRSDPWSQPVSLAGAANVGIVDYGATPIPDMSRVLLCRQVPEGVGQSDIWEAAADFTAWTLDTAVLVPELASTVADCSSSVSPSGREIFFESTRPVGAGWGLWTATREDPTGAWDMPVAVAELDVVASDEVDPWLSPDRRTLWFAGGAIGTYDLYVATRE